MILCFIHFCELIENTVRIFLSLYYYLILEIGDYLMSIEEKFLIFLNEIKVPDQQDEEAKKWTRKIKEGLESEASTHIEKIFLSGSVKRRTAIKPLHDVDLYVVVKDSYTKGANFSRGLKNFFQSILQQFIEQGTSIAFMDHGLKIVKGDFQTDLVIARYFENETDVYWILNGNNWIKTSTVDHEKRLADINRKTDGYAQNFIKLMKAWNKQKKKSGVGKPMNSFHIEVLVLDHIPHEERSYENGTIILFECFTEAVKERKSHTLEGAPHIDEMTPQERERAISLLDLSLKQAEAGDWKLVFGNKFPD